MRITLKVKKPLWRHYIIEIYLPTVDDNPLVRADQDGNAWMVAAASFVAGMGLSVGCQMIFEGKNLSVDKLGSLPLPQDLEPLWDFLGIGWFDNRCQL